MFTKTRKAITLILSIILVSSMVFHPLYATSIEAKEIQIQPRWTNASSIFLAIDVNSPNLKLSATITGYSGCTYKNGTAVLEKISGTGVGIKKTWRNLASNNSVFKFTDSSVVGEPGVYRFTITIDVVRNGVTETVTSTKDATYN